MADAIGASVITRVWRTLLTLLPSSSGPIAIRHAPSLALGRLGSLSEPFSSIQYPTGTRAHLLAAAERLMEPLPPLGREDSKFNGYQELNQLNEDVLSFGDLATSRQAEVLSCLNCMTEQRTAFGLIPKLSSEYFADPEGCCVLYEAARALIRVKPKDRQSRDVLKQLSQQDHNPRMAIAAAIQLGAACIRLDQDLDAGAEALEVADRRRRELDRATSPFVATVLDSRYFRALALLALRRREFPVLRSAMEQAMATAEGLMEQTTPEDEYPWMVAQENMRLVVEVHLVAGSGAQKPDQFAMWAKRLIDLDSEDPFTWQYLAMYGARCGCVVEAALAVSGLAAIGGLEFDKATEAIGKAAINDFSDESLTSKILSTLETIVRPDSSVAVA